MANASPLHETGCILIVDDEAALRRVFAKSLRSAGHEVVEAASGKQAADLLTQRQFDAVVSDIHMPDIDGVELLRLVGLHQPDVPVLLLTGAPQLETAVKAVEYGAFEYLTKPIELVKLKASVARAVLRRRASTDKRRISGEDKPSQPRAKVTEVRPGNVLGNYRLGNLIGSGGMGTVHEAVRLDLAHMRVAVKVLHPRLGDRPDLVARCRREAEVVAGLNHPNIVKVIDFVSDGDVTFLVMELLKGTTLASEIQHEPRFSPERVVFIASQILSALGAAHAADVVHRNLKPDNVFLITTYGLNDVVKLLDFGIAKLLGDTTERKLTETGVVLGTPAYMAPEYARGEKADARADIYGVGCIMYEALARKQPFAGDNYNAILYAIQQKQPTPLGSLRPDIAPELVAIVEKAMAKDPAARFQSVSEMDDALAPWLVRASGTRKPSIPALASAPTVPVSTDDDKKS